LVTIGISGIPKTMAFKRAEWPGLEEREYRISQGHDAAAAIVVDGRVVAAAAEERFNRQKHSGAFPHRALRFCLDRAGLELDDVDEIAHAFDYAPLKEIFALDPTSARLYAEVFSREALLAELRTACPDFPPERFTQVNHHLCHAASTYLTSGWDECLAIVIDAIGETQSVSVFHGDEGRLEKLREIPANDSIGILYSLVTLHLGFDFNSDEYKIMGLAPYGDPQHYAEVFQKLVKCRPDGSVRIPPLRLNQTRDEREQYLRTRAWLTEHLMPPRHPDAPITQDHCDAAAALQACLDQAILHICGHFGQSTGLRRLALAGGVALNCTANGRLMKSGLFDEIYVQPASGDDGAAVGAALYRASLASPIRNERFPTPLLGPAYDRDAVEAAIGIFADRVQVRRFGDLLATCIEAARQIAQGRVIAWDRGRMEFGPRALGARSILADPGDPEMRDRINAMVKKREGFRPFAPAVTIEQVDRWFNVPPLTSLAYMTFTVDVREEFRAALPAITHVNGSARVQTVSQNDNPDFHLLLREVGKVSGREMVLNTSFNVKGQPIVNTPAEAIETFLGTGIDALFVENTLIERKPAA
jgi:carbamoyltransferase